MLTSVGDPEIVQLLLSACAGVDVRDNYGDTALLCAVHRGGLPVIKLLIDAGADVDSLNSHNGYTVLMLAAHKGDMDVVQLLLDSGARDDDPTGEAHTPLYLAARRGHADLLELFIRRGCPINNSKSVLVELFFLVFFVLGPVHLLTASKPGVSNLSGYSSSEAL